MIPDKISNIRAAASNMAEECKESSAATSTSPTNNWWPSNSLSSWSNNNVNTPWKYPQNPNYSNNISSEEEEDVSMSTSFTNASNHSGLTIESSRNELIGETVPSGNHLWNHVLLNVGNNVELQNKYQDDGENMISAFSRKNLSNGTLFDPACDYLKKLDNGNWDLPSSTPFNNFEKNFNGYNDAIFQPEKLTKLSNNSASNWSIPPPDPEINRQLIDPLACNISLSPTSLDSDVCYMKASVNRKLTDLILADEQITEIEASSENLLQKSLNDIGYQTGMNNVMVPDNTKFYDSNMTDVLCNDGRNYADVMSFPNCLSKPWMNNINATKPILKSLNLSDCKKQALQASFTPAVSTCNTVTKGNRRGQVMNEGKKKRSEENLSDAVLKKPKQESSLATSLKVPKAKLGEKITALQQIVSPFGKTDTASVLWEAIGYIKFLQEQVQLLSNPYMKTNAIKDPWGAIDRKDRGELRVDLKSRGLCLVPVSCTPQVYRENVGPDYLAPAYRGCLYR